MADMVWTLESIESLQETDEVEAKLAAGKDGRGELPKDFWPTYSAFANGTGGYVALGVREKQGVFSIDNGILNPNKVVGRIFDQACNPQKVSANVLGKDDVDIIDIAGKSVIIVRVPPAAR